MHRMKTSGEVAAIPGPIPQALSVFFLDRSLMSWISLSRPGWLSPGLAFLQICHHTQLF